MSGVARTLARSMSVISPWVILSANLGTGNRVGLLSTPPRVRVNSELVTGLGEQRLTGPLRSSRSRIHSMARTMSCLEIQLRYCAA